MSTPDYYQFPYGIEPILISRHLTSNGGQILQYVARSTRLDGKNKHDREGRMDDLRKLIDLAYDEINRLEEEAEEDESEPELFAAGTVVVDYSDAPYLADPLEDEVWDEFFRGYKFRTPRLDDENAYEEETTYLTGGNHDC